MKIENLPSEVVLLLREKGLTLATAESCTGGGIGYAITAVSGSSAVYLGGVVSYANEIKNRILGVPEDILISHGAVSELTAIAMAEGARSLIGSDIAVSVTGIAGPASDDTNKPVGLVYIAVSAAFGTDVKEYHFSGSREDVRTQTIDAALELVYLHIK